MTKTVRTVMASVADIRTYVYGATYDSWNRVQTMTYPDGEVVTYHYNAAGQVESLTSNKQGRQSVIVDRIGYDKEGHTVYTKLGNGDDFGEFLQVRLFCRVLGDDLKCFT